MAVMSGLPLLLALSWLAMDARSALAFQNQPFLCKSPFVRRCASSAVAPLQVSKKEKMRLREEEERIRALHELEDKRARRELASKISLAKKAAAVKKLILEAEHDGLKDIGDEARVLALRKFNSQGHHRDMFHILASRSTDNESGLSAQQQQEQQWEMDMFRLFTEAAMGHWEDAASYAEIFYKGSAPQLDERAFATIEDERERIRQVAIQAFANADRNLPGAFDLYKPKIDPASVTNALMRCKLRQDMPADARALFRQAKQSTLDKESFRLALSASAKLGDATLAKEALNQLAAPSKTDLRMAFETICSTEILSREDFKVAIEVLDKLQKKNAVDGLKPNAFSVLLSNIDEASDLRNVFMAAKQATQSSSPQSWPGLLSPETRVRVLPALVASNDDDDAQDILKSLVMDKNAGAISISTPFLKKQSSDFWRAAFLLSARRRDLIELASSIEKEHDDVLGTDPPTLEAKLAVIGDFHLKTMQSSDVVGMVTHVLFSALSSAKHSTDVSENENKNATTFSNPAAELRTSSELGKLVCDLEVLLGIVASEPRMKEYKTVLLQAFRCVIQVLALEKDDESNCFVAYHAIDSIFEKSLEIDMFAEEDLFDLAIRYYFSLSRAYVSNAHTAMAASTLFPTPEMLMEAMGESDRMGEASLQLEYNETVESGGNTTDERRLLEGLIERAVACDKASGGSSNFSLLLFGYRKFLCYLWGHPSFFLSEYLYAGYKRTVIAGALASTDTNIGRWFQDLWGVESARTVLKSLLSLEIVERWIKAVSSRDCEFQTQFLWLCIKGMYGLSDAFAQMNLGEAFSSACFENLLIIADHLFSSRLKRDYDGVESVSAQQWAAVVHGIIESGHAILPLGWSTSDEVCMKNMAIMMKHVMFIFLNQPAIQKFDKAYLMSVFAELCDDERGWPRLYLGAFIRIHPIDAVALFAKENTRQSKDARDLVHKAVQKTGPKAVKAREKTMPKEKGFSFGKASRKKPGNKRKRKK